MPRNASHPPSARPRDDSDIRSLQRSYINLSQATTLVGSESDGDDDVEQRARATGGPTALRDNGGGRLHGQRAGVEAGVNAGTGKAAMDESKRRRRRVAARVCEVCVERVFERSKELDP
jgi:hypothetical protein